MARTIADALNELVNGEPNGLKPQINKKAPIDSPALTGTPTAPTPAEGDNSTKLATTAFVQNVVNKLLSFADEDLNTFAEVIDEIKAMRSAQASSTDFGMVKVGSNISVADGTISLTKSNVVNALGYTPPESGGSSVTLENSTGSSTTAGMTQAAITTALGGKLGTTAKAASATTADSASKVTGGTIQLTGSVTGSGSFNSSGNVTINTSGGGTTYSTGTASTAGITKLYTSTGSSTDGTMTRQAITNELNNKATTAALNSLQSTVNNKANASDLSSLQSTVSSLQSTVNDKVDYSEYLTDYRYFNGLISKGGDYVNIKSANLYLNGPGCAIERQTSNVVHILASNTNYYFKSDGIYKGNTKIAG